MMIRLKDLLLLNEFDYGKQLFGRGRAQLIYTPAAQQKLGIDVNEPNTPDEEELLWKLYDWIMDERPGDALADDVLWTLKSLKPKFPEILDPRKSKFDYVYRGATIPYKDILKAGPYTSSSDPAWQSPNLGTFTKRSRRVRAYAASNKLMNVPTKATRGWVSFTSDPATAREFFGQRTSVHNYRSPNDPVPCILKVSTRNPNLLFNPEWLQYIARTGMDEQECLYLTDKYIKVDSILIDEVLANTLNQNQKSK